MEQQSCNEAVSILHELDLGQHTLFLRSDGGMNLLANDEHTPYLADNGMYLDSDETYRLFVSLKEQFQPISGRVAGAPSFSSQRKGE